MTGRECGREARGLAGLLPVAAEVPEEYFSTKGFPPEKCGV